VDKVTGEKLYNTYYMQVFSFVMSLAGNKDLAEEITQETFYRALTADRAAYRGESGEMTWLCAIAKNLLIDETRKNAKKQEFPPDLDSGINLEAAVSDREMSFLIHKTLHSMEEPYREVFELRVFGELSFLQISQIFGKTESWARVTYHRARLKIQERLGEHNE